MNAIKRRSGPMRPSTPAVLDLEFSSSSLWEIFGSPWQPATVAYRRARVDAGVDVDGVVVGRRGTVHLLSRAPAGGSIPASRESKVQYKGKDGWGCGIEEARRRASRVEDPFSLSPRRYRKLWRSRAQRSPSSVLMTSRRNTRGCLE